MNIGRSTRNRVPVNTNLSKYAAFRSSIAIAMCLSIGLALMRAPFDSYDWINRRWLQGWIFLNQPSSETSSGWEFFARPFLNDAMNAWLVDLGGWWLAAVIIGAIHGLLFVILLHIGRIFMPQVPSLLILLFGFSAWSGPLIFEHFGTESGHVLSAVAFAAAMAELLAQRHSPRPGVIGALLGVALLIKFSSVALALVILAVIAATRTARFLIQCLFASAQVLISYFVLLGLWRRTGLLDSVTVIDRSVTLLLLVVVGLALIVVSQWFRRTSVEASSFRGKPSWSIAWAGLGAVFVAGFFMVQPDVRYRPDGVWDGIRRTLNQGGNFSLFRFLKAPQDLEMSYFDMSKGVALIVFVAAIGQVIKKRNDADHVGKTFLAMVPFLTLLQVEVTTGYVRYATEALILLPITILPNISEHCAGRRPLKEVVLCSVIFLMPFLGAGDYVGYSPLDASLPEAFLGKGEAEVMANLFSEHAVVFLQGERSWLLPPLVDRSDLRLEIQPRRPHQVGGPGDAHVIYDLTESEKLDKYTTREWSLSRCQALRFENVDLGWCHLTANTER